MRFNVSGDLLVPFLLEIEAESAEQAEEIVESMAPTEILKDANTENSAMGISVDYAEPGDNL